MKRKDKLPKNTKVVVNAGSYYRQPAWEKQNGLWTGGPLLREFATKVTGLFLFSSPDNGPHSKIVEIGGEYIEVDKCDLELDTPTGQLRRSEECSTKD